MAATPAGRAGLALRSAAVGAAAAFAIANSVLPPGSAPAARAQLSIISASPAHLRQPPTASSAPLGIDTLLADATTSVVAHGAVPVVPVYRSPGDDSPVFRLDHPTLNDQPLVFLVTRARADGWLEVLLPVRPNGTAGWVRTDHVDLHHHRFRLVVDLGRRVLDLYEAGERTRSMPVAVGASDTPTPGGTFYVKELLRPPRPDTLYGPYAFGLSGFSNALESFAGGDGVIGIHGTNDPSSIGREVSAGCIRLHNHDLEHLVGLLPLGTPVDIRA